MLYGQTTCLGDDIQLEGICKVPAGLAIITSQPYVSGRHPTRHEIEEWFALEGYEKTGYLRWKHPVSKTSIADAHEGNFIMADNGVLFPIDLQILDPGILL